MKYAVILIAVLLAGCSGLPFGPGATELDNTQEIQTAPSLEVEGETVIATSSTVVETVSTQDASTVKAETFTGEIVTVNEDGLSPWMWLLIGMLLPMPKFMKYVF
tara:strand:- start:241 stop:555 length:315 start_codon:yes stop_codon:yes gene_type:complete